MMTCFTVCFISAAAALIAGIAAAVYIGRGKRRYIITAGFLAGAFFLFIPSVIDADWSAGPLTVILVSVLRSLRTMFLNEDYIAGSSVYTDNVPHVFGMLYRGLLTLFYVLTPLLTYAWVHAFIDSGDEQLRLKAARLLENKIYVFSNANERAVSLAMSIEKSEKSKKAKKLSLCFSIPKRPISPALNRNTRHFRSR